MRLFSFKTRKMYLASCSPKRLYTVFFKCALSCCHICSSFDSEVKSGQDNPNAPNKLLLGALYNFTSSVHKTINNSTKLFQENLSFGLEWECTTIFMNWCFRRYSFNNPKSISLSDIKITKKYPFLSHLLRQLLCCWSKTPQQVAAKWGNLSAHTACQPSHKAYFHSIVFQVKSDLRT